VSNQWYAHYPGDYGRDTAHLSLVEHGAYRPGRCLPIPPRCIASAVLLMKQNERPWIQCSSNSLAVKPMATITPVQTLSL
jgi:hypothetical protein